MKPPQPLKRRLTAQWFNLRSRLAFWFRRRLNWDELVAAWLAEPGDLHIHRSPEPARARRTRLLYYLAILGALLLIYYYKYVVLIRGR